ncbi:MAG TPA: hypothetical protein PLT24_05645 [Bacillota bacterium]|nr:hypothetical protein [Bacillota bacterium]
MPLTVYELFVESGIEINGQVLWGEAIRDNKPGIYVVSISSNPKKLKTLTNPPIDSEITQDWLEKVNTLRVDGERPSNIDLIQRLSKFWIPDETILYIGKAGTSVRDRVNQYYKTKLGEPRPHAGGHWLKTLLILYELTVFWALTDKPELIEQELLFRFTQGVSAESKNKLIDSSNPIPFANLEYPRGNRKKHGITRSKIKK